MGSTARPCAGSDRSSVTIDSRRFKKRPVFPVTAIILLNKERPIWTPRFTWDSAAAVCDSHGTAGSAAQPRSPCAFEGAHLLRGRGLPERGQQGVRLTQGGLQELSAATYARQVPVLASDARSEEHVCERRLPPGGPGVSACNVRSGCAALEQPHGARAPQVPGLKEP
eukprot:scaffold1900_cov389-Prasinococcus_capsulatus_cf.AAC.28